MKRYPWVQVAFVFHCVTKENSAQFFRIFLQSWTLHNPHLHLLLEATLPTWRTLLIPWMWSKKSRFNSTSLPRSRTKLLCCFSWAKKVSMNMVLITLLLATSKVTFCWLGIWVLDLEESLLKDPWMKDTLSIPFNLEGMDDWDSCKWTISPTLLEELLVFGKILTFPPR